MIYKKDGVVRDEFFPQDLSEDLKGQEQASKLVKGIRLRRALTKAGASKDECDAFVKIWLNQIPSKEVILNLDFRKLAANLADNKPTEGEIEVFRELRVKFLGF